MFVKRTVTDGSNRGVITIPLEAIIILFPLICPLVYRNFPALENMGFANTNHDVTQRRFFAIADRGRENLTTFKDAPNIYSVCPLFLFVFKIVNLFLLARYLLILALEFQFVYI